MSVLNLLLLLTNYLSLEMNHINTKLRVIFTRNGSFIKQEKVDI